MRKFFSLIFAAAFVINAGASNSNGEPLGYSDMIVIADIDLKAGRYESAVASYRGAIKEAPQKLWIYGRLVKALLAQGNVDKSEWKVLLSEFEKGILSQTKTAASVVSEIPPAIVSGGSNTFFALAQVAEEAGLYETAWKYYLVVNEFESRKRRPYNFLQTSQQENTVTQLFTEGFWPSASEDDAAIGDPSRLPIFVVGMPYSGSNVLQRVLDAHSKVFDLNAHPSYYESIADKMGRGLRYSIFEGRFQHIQRSFASMQSTSENESEKGRQELTQHATGVVNDMAMIANYISGVSPAESKILYSLDTQLENYRLIGFIHLLFPNAVVVNVMRDPMDVLLDCFRDRMGHTRDFSWSTDLDNLVKHFLSYLRIMAHWRKTLPGVVFDIRSESLMSDPKKELEVLFQELHLEWQEDVQDDLELRDLISPEGTWRSFGDIVSTFRDELKSGLEELKESGDLPFDNEMNWDLNSDFKYKTPKSTKKETTTSTTTASSDNNSKTSKKSPEPVVNSKGATTKSSRKVEVNVDANDDDDDDDEDDIGKDTSVELEHLYNSVVSPSDRTMLRSLSAQLPSLSGNSMIDEIVTAAFIKVQRQDASGAERIFKQLLEIRDDVQAVWTGLGTLYMNSGRNDEALEVANQMIRINPKNSEGYRLRSDVLMRDNDEVDNAVKDLNKAVELNPKDVQALLARGRYNIRAKFFKQAQADFLAADSVQPSAISKYYLAQCEIQFAHISKAIAYYEESIAIDPNIKEVYLQKAHSEMEGARWKDGLKTLQKAIQMDPTNRYVHSFRGLLLHDIGRPAAAVEDFQRALDLEPRDVSVMVLMAICLQSLGRMADTVKLQNKVLELIPTHKVWAARDLAAFWWVHFHDDFKTFNIDNDADAKVRSGRVDDAIAEKRFILTTYLDKIPSLDKPQPPLIASKEALHLLSLTSHMGKWVQLDCEGFVPSVRQHRQFGLAVLEMAQTIRRHVALLQKGEMGLQVSDSTSSRKSSAWSAASKKGCKTGHHRLGYRDLMDIAVRWRQLSEPNDAVYWFDRLPEDEQGYSLMTHMVQGEMELIRYYTYYSWGFKIMKTKLATEFYAGNNTQFKKPSALNKEKLKKLEKAKDLHDLYSLVNEPLWVIAPVKGIHQKGKVLDGTRIVLTPHKPEGYAFTIQTPINIGNRNPEFELELEAAFDRLLKCLLNNNNNSENNVDDNDLNLACTQRHGLELFYYWANFGPITRGTAATGYAVLLASILAGGHVIGKKMPKQRQLDWEAIFTPEPSDFLRHGQSWVDGLIPAPFSEEVLDGAVGYSVADIINTPAKTLAVLAKLTGKDEEEEYPFVQNGQILDKSYLQFLAGGGAKSEVEVDSKSRQSKEEEDEDDDDEDEDEDDEEDDDDEDDEDDDEDD